MEKKINKKTGISSEEKITRKAALKKAGITVLTAASLVFLQTKVSATVSKPTAPNAPGRRR